MKIKFEIFEKHLKSKNMTIKDFMDYAKVEQKEIDKWKKEDDVPKWAFVIVRDKATLEYMYERRREEDKYIKSGKVKIRCDCKIKGFSQRELKEIQSAFWGSNYCPKFTIWVVKRMQNNIPEKLFKKILKRNFKWGELASNV